MPERIKKIRDFFGVPSRSDFASWDNFLKSPVMTWLFLLILATTITFLAEFSFKNIPVVMEEGMVADRDIKADRNYEIVDEEATTTLKSEAKADVLPVYSYNLDMARSVTKRVYQSFKLVREQIKTLLPIDISKERKTTAVPKEKDLEEIREKFSESLGVMVQEDDFRTLLKENFNSRIETTIANILSSRLSVPVVAEKINSEEDAGRGIILQHIRHENEEPEIIKESIVANPVQMLAVGDVRQKITPNDLRAGYFKSGETKNAIITIVKSLIEPNVSLNQIETDMRKAAADKSVQNVILRVKSGEMIVRNGSRFDAAQIKILKGIRREKTQRTYPLEFLGTVAFILLLIIVIYFFAEKFILRFHPTRHDYFLMAVLAIGHVAIMRLGFSLAIVFHDALPFEVPVSALIFAIPIASSAMLLRMFLHAEDTIIFVVSITLLSSIFADVDLRYISFFIVSNTVGIAAIANTDKRSAIIRAGIITGIVNVIAVFAIGLIGMASIALASTTYDLVWCLVCAFLGGLVSATMITIMAPIIESILGYTTDIKLLELANLNHPLLRELIVRAPGTYHHSHLVGIIGEAAAEEIGANALLVRVAAYYHDIGKIKKPVYFVENYRDSEDKHLKLSPHMSSLIISSHIKDGVEMAKNAKLPRSIIDLIIQHHGTRPISFFYEKAKGMEDPENEKIDPMSFEYEGPKPQTREAAILMLADIAEASVRALKEKSVTRIQQTVDRVIHTCFTEKQLDECDLTLRHLNDISKAFTHILLGIYHQRIDYPVDTSTAPNLPKGRVEAPLSINTEHTAGFSPRSRGIEKEKAGEDKISQPPSDKKDLSGKNKEGA